MMAQGPAFWQGKVLDVFYRGHKSWNPIGSAMETVIDPDLPGTIARRKRDKREKAVFC
jgi:hypothetical protein